MSYFRKLETKLTHLQELFDRAERWLIVINADPDAMASALALKRIMIHRVDDVAIARVNEITRPDNLAMARYLRIPMVKLTPTLSAQFDRFAVVDSQPHHHPSFKDLHFSLVIDHHPLVEEHPVVADFKEIRNEYGATSTIMTEYLYNLGIRPGKLLATALQFGIKTDTASFERAFHDVDMARLPLPDQVRGPCPAVAHRAQRIPAALAGLLLPRVHQHAQAGHRPVRVRGRGGKPGHPGGHRRLLHAGA